MLHGIEFQLPLAHVCTDMFAGAGMPAAWLFAETIFSASLFAARDWSERQSSLLGREGSLPPPCCSSLEHRTELLHRAPIVANPLRVSATPCFFILLTTAYPRRHETPFRKSNSLLPFAKRSLMSAGIGCTSRRWSQPSGDLEPQPEVGFTDLLNGSNDCISGSIANHCSFLVCMRVSTLRTIAVSCAYQNPQKSHSRNTQEIPCRRSNGAPCQTCTSAG